MQNLRTYFRSFLFWFKKRIYLLMSKEIKNSNNQNIQGRKQQQQQQKIKQIVLCKWRREKKHFCFVFFIFTFGPSSQKVKIIGGATY